MRSIHDQSVIITHPCHALNGKSVPVIHFRKKSKKSSILVEFPDGSAHEIPVSWTNQAKPDPKNLSKIVKNLRLSPYALLEAGEWLKKQKNIN